MKKNMVLSAISFVRSLDGKVSGSLTSEVVCIVSLFNFFYFLFFILIPSFILRSFHSLHSSFFATIWYSENDQIPQCLTDIFLCKRYTNIPRHYPKGNSCIKTILGILTCIHPFNHPLSRSPDHPLTHLNPFTIYLHVHTHTHTYINIRIIHMTAYFYLYVFSISTSSKP